MDYVTPSFIISLVVLFAPVNNEEREVRGGDEGVKGGDYYKMWGVRKGWYGLCLGKRHAIFHYLFGCAFYSNEQRGKGGSGRCRDGRGRLLQGMGRKKGLVWIMSWESSRHFSLCLVVLFTSMGNKGREVQGVDEGVKGEKTRRGE